MAAGYDGRVAMAGFPVLMYHRVVSAHAPVPGGDADETRYAVSLEEFVWQLDHLRAAGRTAVSMPAVHERLNAGERIPDDWVVLTFDDGNASDYVHALPLLTERGFGATFYVCGCRVGADGGLEQEMVREMADAGLHVGAHGMTHRYLTSLDAASEEAEIRESRDLLSGIVDGPVTHFAPPGGRYSGRTLATLRQLSFEAVGTSDFGLNARGGERLTYRRIPITAATSRAQFRAIVEGRRLRLAVSAARARVLVSARRVLGESAYRRLRRVGLGRS